MVVSEESRKSEIAGHSAALLTILIWGTTYISTKVLLRAFLPIEILFIRFVMGFVVLFLLKPKRLVLKDKRERYTFIAAGFCGITLYYLLENIALTMTTASNVGVIISVAPFFTAILTQLVSKDHEKMSGRFVIGFILAMIGVSLINFNDTALKINPLGDLLALAAAVVWAIYSVLSRKISSFGYPVIQVTRKVFGYGILLMVPTLFFFDFKPNIAALGNGIYLLNLMYLGLGASALCFVTWQVAVGKLGAVKTSIYIYLVPVITIVTSIIVLREKMTPALAMGTFLTLVGLLLSQSKGKGTVKKLIKSF